MFDLVEVYALVLNREIKGYRFYVSHKGQELYYDVQTDDTSLSYLCEGRLPLKAVGSLLLTDNEIKGKYKPIPLTDAVLYRELVHRVQYFHRIKNEGREVY